MHRSIPPIGAVVLAALLPAAASATPLLSGYGGPGQGNQAILGSALLNGRGGGSGGGGSSGGGSSSPSASSLAAQTTPARAPSSSHRQRASGAAGKHGVGVRTPRPRGGEAGNASEGAAGAYTSLARARAAHPLLGLTRSDLLYIVLAFGVLTFTGVLTRRLAARQTASGGGGSRGAAQTPTSTYE
jgi:hypothetical protein